jgi:hypothetical protein
MRSTTKVRTKVIIFGLILWVLGYLLGISILQTIGTVLLVVGLILLLLGMAGRQIGPRSHYW